MSARKRTVERVTYRFRGSPSLSVTLAFEPRTGQVLTDIQETYPLRGLPTFLATFPDGHRDIVFGDELIVEQVPAPRLVIRWDRILTGLAVGVMLAAFVVWGFHIAADLTAR